ncbi:Uncharacterised protein [Legionella cincinnatiensis]|uniref:Uncharacterized protein n=2 Tax=Legionella cincinnatiensis TaxID=28085 RepID=A0A378ISD1_9GAMM|nr:hypothetical protein Lcin_3158 [Legionella cincinnatiensis]STX34874.1 Uncharacterised protein [Legionella cincinnatiensis]
MTNINTTWINIAYNYNTAVLISMVYDMVKRKTTATAQDLAEHIKQLENLLTKKEEEYRSLVSNYNKKQRNLEVLYDPISPLYKDLKEKADKHFLKMDKKIQQNTEECQEITKKIEEFKLAKEKQPFIEKLEKYIARIESHKKGGEIDFEHGFLAFKESRGNSRKENYLLAQAMLKELKNEKTSLKDVFSQNLKDPKNLEKSSEYKIEIQKIKGSGRAIHGELKEIIQDYEKSETAKLRM